MKIQKSHQAPVRNVGCSGTPGKDNIERSPIELRQSDVPHRLQIEAQQLPVGHDDGSFGVRVTRLGLQDWSAAWMN
jgi:hypothetical protein